EYGLHDDLTALNVARFPDVLSVEKKDLDAEAISEGLAAITEAALKDFDAMRLREGEKLREDVLSRLGTIRALVETVEQESPKTVAAYRARLETKMAEVLDSAGIDENRILAEAAIFADHIAVDEETVRLRSHMSQLETMINGNSPTGRKIDFLIQEFNREANTIGSKCQNSDIAHTVVDLKSEIEKIREQIQNIE
ncbi:MAG: YicC family protein, partial [Thermoguttaceae bacterium]|nr:YicC family protein [Thermoguttaceae bacterium]